MRRYWIEIAGKQYTIDVQELAADRFYVLAEGQEFQVKLTASRDLAEAAITPEISPIQRTGAPLTDLRPPALETLPPVPAAPQPALPPMPHLPADGFNPDVIAPMPGTILEVNVKAGDRIMRGQTVVILEAMKMKNAIKSPHDGVIVKVLAQPGQSVGYGETLVRLEQVQA